MIELIHLKRDNVETSFYCHSSRSEKSGAYKAEIPRFAKNDKQKVSRLKSVAVID